MISIAQVIYLICRAGASSTWLKHWKNFIHCCLLLVM